MEHIIDLIFDNFLIVAVIVGGLLKFLSGDSKQAEENRKKPHERSKNIPRPTPTPSGGKYIPPQAKKVVTKSAPNIESMSIEEQQQEQLERLAGQLKSDLSKTLHDVKSTKDATPLPLQLNKSVKNNVNRKQKPIKKVLRTKLSRDGLMESIIMAEVLGSPRATKPYQSVVAERKQRQ